MFDSASASPLPGALPLSREADSTLTEQLAARFVVEGTIRASVYQPDCPRHSTRAAHGAGVGALVRRALAGAR